MATPVAVETNGADTLGELEAAHIDRRWVIQRDGKPYVLVNGLIDMLHQLSGGSFAIDTEVVQVPGAGNGEVAVVKAVVKVYDPGSTRVLRQASGIGDAGPQSVNRMIAPHSLRMAETRAVGRALRLITNIGMTALEELGGPDPAGSSASAGGPPSAAAPHTPAEAREAGLRAQGRRDQGLPPEPVVEGIVVEGKRYTREQVWGFYQQRLQQAKQQGIAVPAAQLVERSAPLPDIVGATQTIRKLHEAKGGTPA